MIVFGGTDSTGTRLNETWALDLAGEPTWHALAPAGVPPPPIMACAAVYDPVRDRVLVIGGHQSTVGAVSSVWALSLAEDGEWTLLSPLGAAPPPMHGASAVYDARRDRVLVYGDTSPSGQVDVLSLSDTPTWSVAAIEGEYPRARIGHAAVFDPEGDRMIAFGGADWKQHVYLNDAVALRVLEARLTAFEVSSTIEGVELRWHVEDATPGFSAWLERAESATGPWATAECERSSDGEVTVEVDRTTAPARTYWYRLVVTDRGLTRALGEPIRIETAPPTRFALLGTGPNPSPGAAEATFQLAHAAEIAVELFDAQGRRVATLASGSWPAGIHRAKWTGARPASGVYHIRYRYPGGEDFRRISIVR
jgi:hypothetical protein